MNSILINIAIKILEKLFITLIKSAKSVRKTKKKLDRKEVLKNAKKDDDFVDNVADDHIM